MAEADEFAMLETVVRGAARFVFKVAYGVLRNPHDAEDVVQEVYLRVHRSGIRDVADLRAWLARVTFRLAIDRLRRPGIDLDGVGAPQPWSPTLNGWPCIGSTYSGCRS